uniref:F-box domain-containing protein n=1 Tax=Oryza glumipatula TaxID=40148 RepID=A0A0E0AFD1_9ORYZ
MAAPAPELMDDVVEEILLRLPLDDPSCAARASAVCKHWRHLLADAGFLRRYRAFHRRRAPPRLGFIYDAGSPLARFAPTTAFRPADLDHDGWKPMDCRHGRALFRTSASAVLCAVSGCDHGGCHGGPFAVAFVANYVMEGEEEEITSPTSAWLYSSETGTWSAPSTVRHHNAEPFPKPSVLAGDGAVYFLTWHGRNILRYDLRKLDLTVIASPEIDDDDFENHLLMTTEDGGMGLARLVSGHSLQLWSWKPVSAAAAWVQLRVIDLDLVIPGDAMRPRLLGFAEGTDMVFVDTTYDGAQVVQQIELSTLKVTKVLDECYASCRQKGKLPPSAITLVAYHGELAPECVSTYFKYGCALLYKAQDEADPLGNVPKSSSNKESMKSTTNKDDSGSSKTPGSNTEDAPSTDKADAEEGQNSNGKGQEEENGDSDKDDDEMVGDEDDSDLDQAWKMLDIARAIVEKSPDDTLEKAKIFSALAEVSMEREDIDNSLGDYFKALAILEKLNFRICLVYELVSKISDAIPYCAKAISLCKSRIQSLKNDKDALLAGKDDNASAADGGSEKSAPEGEIEQLSGILSELEKKLEDLEQAMSTPSSVMDEIMKRIASKAGGEQNATDTMPVAASFNSSSQMAGSSNGFDSSTLSTAATTGSTGSTVTDLGVVGRGIKRANIKPISAEPPPKRAAADSLSVKGDSSNNNSDVHTPAQEGDDSVSK